MFRGCTHGVHAFARRGLRDDIGNLSPASFAIVMATGIVSIATYSLGMTGVGLTLFGINVCAFAVLWVLNLARLARHPRRALAETKVRHARPAGSDGRQPQNMRAGMPARYIRLA